MRIAIGGFSHETNVFGSLKVTMDVIRNGWEEGQALLSDNRGSRNYLGGYIAAAEDRGVELVATVSASAVPSGIICREVLESARERLVELLWQAHQEKPLDGIALAMHGAGVAEGYPDVEGEILRAVREKFGSEMPVSVVLDLHGNISPEMVERSDVLAGVKCYPHVDQYETAYQVMERLCDRIQSGKKVYRSVVKLPWLIAPGEGVTLSGAAHNVQQFCLQRERENPELLLATFFHGFAYADVSFAGAAVVTNAASQAAADAEAKRIAEYAWSIRKTFRIPLYSAEEAVDHALAMGEGPIMINEGSDNTGGGAPGDGTHLLREMLKRNEISCFCYIWDPEVVQQAIAAGIGATISCRLGGKTQAIHGEPIALENAYVRVIGDGKYVTKSPMGAGNKRCIGPVVCLQVGNVSVIVGTGRTQTFDDQHFICAGVDWERMRLLAVKSSQHFKGWWGDKVKGIVACESPGVHSSDLRVFPFKQANTSYYPLGDPEWE